jgi:hypothetical protein
VRRAAKKDRFIRQKVKKLQEATQKEDTLISFINTLLHVSVVDLLNKILWSRKLLVFKLLIFSWQILKELTEESLLIDDAENR